VHARPAPTCPSLETSSDCKAVAVLDFKRNAHRMRYQHFRDLGMFIGSGAIEGGIKAIVVQRAKQPGMHWTKGVVPPWPGGTRGNVVGAVRVWIYGCACG
jgi:hypothetical protein